MRHLQSNDCYTNPFARYCGFNFLSYIVREKIDTCEQFGVKLEEVVDLIFWDDKCMSFREWTDVEEG